MITFLKQLVHEGEVMVIDNVEEIAEKKYNGESTLSNYAKFLTRTLTATIVVFLLWLLISFFQGLGFFDTQFGKLIIVFLTVITGLSIGAWIYIKLAASIAHEGNLQPDIVEEMTEEACNDHGEPILHSCNLCPYFTLQICFFVYYCVLLCSLAFAAYNIAQTTVSSIFIIAGKL